jgi:hypothetical protein
LATSSLVGGGSTMDFLNFNHYLSSPLNIKKAIFVASALITPSLKKLCFGTRGGTKVIELEAIMEWPKSHLSLGGGEIWYDIVVIPYHGEAHWSLLVLEPSHTFHFDSKIGDYDMVHFIHLVVQDFIDYGFAWFPKIHHSDEIVSSSWRDLLGFLSFNHE